jgi:LacI family transcriptional regulator/LacI family repressor for deo operon, udp, cdd, tsx, nupC, and nupG
MNKTPRISIKDVAKTAGVSYSTVSRALNNSPLISQDVKEKIREISHSMGYIPNALAQGLQSRLTNSIGLVVTTIADPFFVDIVYGVEDIARKNGVSVFLSTSRNDPGKEMQIIETFNRRRVDGVIVAASRLGEDYANRLEQILIPVILVNNEAVRESKNVYSVSIDDFAGAKIAVNYLINNGHRKIGYIGVKNRPRSNSRRLNGYMSALAESNITTSDEWIAINDEDGSEDFSGDMEAGYRLGEMIIKRDITAIFCYCDTVAAGTLKACREKNKKVPEEISVIGFDNNDLCDIVSPSLSTIAQPKREMGSEAMRMLVSLTRGEDVQDKVYLPELIIRESTAPLNYKYGEERI